MEDFESIVDMFIRFMVIINKLQALRKIYKKKKRKKKKKKKRERYENNEISTK